MQNPIFESKFNKEDLDPHIVFSPSQLDTWDECKKKGQYVYRLNYRNPESSDRRMRRGSVMHWMLQRYYEGQSAIQIITSAENHFENYEDQLLAFECSGIIYRYQEWYQTVRREEDDFNVLAVEQYLLVPWTTPGGHEVFLNGYVDLIYEKKGRLFVVDHKTGGKSWTQNQVFMDRQLMIYCFMLHLMGFTPFAGIINNVKTSVIKDLQMKLGSELFVRTGNNLTPERLQGYMEEVGGSIDDIMELKRYKRHLSYRSCAECTFREACTLELEGNDPTPYLNANFGKSAIRSVPIKITGLPS